MACVRVMCDRNRRGCSRANLRALVTIRLRRVYAIKVQDDFILAPNLAGLGLFGLQLLVYRCHAPFCGGGGEGGSGSETDDGTPAKRRSRAHGEALLADVDPEVPVAPVRVHEPLVSPVADAGDPGGSASPK